MSDGDDLAMRAAREIMGYIFNGDPMRVIGHESIASIIRRVVVEPIMASVATYQKIAADAVAGEAKALSDLADATGEPEC